MTATLEGRRLRVLVVDDHDVVHWGFRMLLGEQPWVERCLAARTGAEALELTRTLRPHVALVDLFLAGESGADVCKSIREASPPTRVLLISGSGRMSPAAARAAAGDMRPEPEISSTRVAGEAWRIEAQTSAPDSPAKKRSTSATSGLSRGSSSSASAPVRAARQR